MEKIKVLEAGKVYIRQTKEGDEIKRIYTPEQIKDIYYCFIENQSMLKHLPINVEKLYINSEGDIVAEGKNLETLSIELA